MQDYKATQKVAAEREAQYMPKVPPAAVLRPGAGSSSMAAAAAAAAAHGGSEADIEAQALLQEQKLQESRAMENTIEFQEALIEERDHGIQGEAGGGVGCKCECVRQCNMRGVQHGLLGGSGAAQLQGQGYQQQPRIVCVRVFWSCQHHGGRIGHKACAAVFTGSACQGCVL